jgi:hypothetical protein
VTRAQIAIASALRPSPIPPDGREPLSADVARRCRLTQPALEELAARQARRRLGQLDPSRVLVGRQLLPAAGEQLVGKFAVEAFSSSARLPHACPS